MGFPQFSRQIFLSKFEWEKNPKATVNRKANFIVSDGKNINFAYTVLPHLLPHRSRSFVTH